MRLTLFFTNTQLFRIFLEHPNYGNEQNSEGVVFVIAYLMQSQKAEKDEVAIEMKKEAAASKDMQGEGPEEAVHLLEKLAMAGLSE